MKPYEVVIIGGGLGGLTCAAALAKKGRRILLLERNPVLGGYQATYKRSGFTIEPCLHVMAEAGPDGSVSQLLRELGLGGEIAFSRFNPTSQFIFPDRTLAIPSDGQEFLGLLKDLFPHESSGIDGIFDCMNGISRGLGDAPGANPMVAEYSQKVLQVLLDQFIAEKKLQTMIAGYCTYFALPPSRVSSLLISAFTASLIFKGGFSPEGGAKSIVDLLEKVVVTHGGEVRKKAPVQSIAVKGGKATGVVLENAEEIQAENVVSNADARMTFFSWVGEGKLPPDYVARLKKVEIMDSALNVFLGVKAQGLGLENMAPAICHFPGYDLDEQYQAMQKGEIERSNFWIGIPTLTNPFMAPEGHHLIVLYVPVPYRLEGIRWRHHKEDFTQRLINMAEKAIPGLRKNIVLVDAATPDTLVRYTGNSQGAVAGWACTPEADALRPANQTPIEGLFLAGHWTLPGPGTGSVMHSGWLTASMIP